MNGRGWCRFDISSAEWLMGSRHLYKERRNVTWNQIQAYVVSWQKNLTQNSCRPRPNDVLLGSKIFLNHRRRRRRQQQLIIIPSTLWMDAPSCSFVHGCSHEFPTLHHSLMFLIQSVIIFSPSLRLLASNHVTKVGLCTLLS